jgi:hypothetical protein
MVVIIFRSKYSEFQITNDEMWFCTFHIEWNIPDLKPCSFPLIGIDFLTSNQIILFSVFQDVDWFGNCLTFLLGIFIYGYEDVAIVDERLQNIGLCSLLFIVSQMLWHRASVFWSHPKDHHIYLLLICTTSKGILRTYSNTYMYPDCMDPLKIILKIVSVRNKLLSISALSK